MAWKLAAGSRNYEESSDPPNCSKLAFQSSEIRVNCHVLDVGHLSSTGRDDLAEGGALLHLIFSAILIVNLMSWIGILVFSIMSGEFKADGERIARVRLTPHSRGIQ